MKRPRLRIFWKIYLNGLLLLAVSMVAVTIAMILVQPESRYHGSPERIQKLLAADLERFLDNPEKLRTELERICLALNKNGAVYTREGALLAASGEFPPPPLSKKELQKTSGWHPLHRDQGGWIRVVALGDGQGPYLLLKGGSAGALALFAPLAAILLTAALVSWPLARALAGPLEKLTNASRSLAKGDLSTRTGLKRNDELGELAKAFDDMAMRLEEHIRNEKNLLANISHEIRTPLARLRVALELLEDAPGDADQTFQRLQGIGLDLTELEILVDNVLTSARLDFTAAEPADLPLIFRTVPLKGFFDEVIERFSRHYPDKEVIVELSGDLPDATIDSKLLNRALDNLLDNAIKYNASDRPVILTADVRDGGLKVGVTDFGEGVPAEDLPRLFTPFFRSRRSRSRQSGGSGLGLTICKRIIEAHGGRIAAELNQDKGMTFTIEMSIKTVR